MMAGVKGKLFVVSAPSGAGKSTLLARVMKEVVNLAFSVSHTTRPPRPGEVDGREYHFVDHGCFERMIEDDLFLEYARVHDNYYGTSRPAIEQQLGAGLDVVLDIDVQGAAILRARGGLPGCQIFVAPPSWEELERRLRGRGTESEESIQIRLKNGRTEMQAIGNYEYLVVNDNLEEATAVLKGIVLAERAKDKRRADGSEAEILS